MKSCIGFYLFTFNMFFFIFGLDFEFAYFCFDCYAIGCFNTPGMVVNIIGWGTARGTLKAALPDLLFHKKGMESFLPVP